MSAAKVRWLELSQLSLCSAFDKENSIEFLLDFLHYLYNYYMVCALFSYAYHVTHHVTSCDIMWCDAVTSCHVTMTMWHLWRDTFPHFPLCSKSKIKEKEKKKKRNIDNNLAVLLSHDRLSLCHKLYSAISPSVLWWFPQSQWHLKVLEKTFQSIPVMFQSNQ